VAQDRRCFKPSCCIDGCRYPVIWIGGELARRSTGVPFSVPWTVYLKTYVPFVRPAGEQNRCGRV